MLFSLIIFLLKCNELAMDSHSKREVLEIFL